MKDLFRRLQLFLNSRHISFGLRMTLGVTVPAAVLAAQGMFLAGITASLGALCVGISDVPGTLSRKRNGMLVALLLVFSVSFLTCLSHGSTVLLFGAIALFAFIFSMFSIYGGRASNIGTACLLTLAFSLEGPPDILGALRYAGFMFAGGVWYFLLSVVLWQIRPYLSARQGLADCLLETAAYMRIKALFYENQPDFNGCHRRLLDVQIKVNERQEEVRELLLKRRSAIQGSNSISRSLVMIFIEVLDLMEETMASHVDYRLLHERFEKTGILLRYQKLIRHMADELENIAAAVVSSSPSFPEINLEREIEAVRQEVDDLKDELLNSDTVDGFVGLKNILRNVSTISQKIKMIHHYTHPNRKELRLPLGKEVELTRFITHQRYDLQIFRNNLTFESSSFRHSLRVTLAAMSAYLISLMLAQEHQYWILMTVIIIMKPAFGSTKKRIYERLGGTLLGGLLGVGIILLVQNSLVLLICLALCIFLAFTCINYNYRLAVIFITPYVLILFQLLDPGNFEIVQERVVDTAIGGGIAFISSYVLWPSWEYMQLKSYLTDILKANHQYFSQVARGYTGGELVRTDYKLARKAVHLSTANVAMALQRMLSEPKSKHKNASEIYSFVVLNHTFSSHIATLMVLLKRKPEEFEQKAFEVVIDKIRDLLEQAEKNLNGEEVNAAAIELPAEFRMLDQKLHLLAAERLNEVKEGKLTTGVREELSLLQALFDVFRNMLNIAAELAKHAQKIHV